MTIEDTKKHLASCP